MHAVHCAQLACAHGELFPSPATLPAHAGAQAAARAQEAGWGASHTGGARRSQGWHRPSQAGLSWDGSAIQHDPFQHDQTVISYDFWSERPPTTPFPCIFKAIMSIQHSNFITVKVAQFIAGTLQRTSRTLQQGSAAPACQRGLIKPAHMKPQTSSRGCAGTRSVQAAPASGRQADPAGRTGCPHM